MIRRIEDDRLIRAHLRAGAGVPADDRHASVSEVHVRAAEDVVGRWREAVVVEARVRERACVHGRVGRWIPAPQWDRGSARNILATPPQQAAVGGVSRQQDHVDRHLAPLRGVRPLAGMMRDRRCGCTWERKAGPDQDACNKDLDRSGDRARIETRHGSLPGEIPDPAATDRLWARAVGAAARRNATGPL